MYIQDIWFAKTVTTTANKNRVLRDDKMNDINKTIKHFESLQKRYTTQHNGQMCERVSDALEALYRFKSQEDYFEKMFGTTKDARK